MRLRAVFLLLVLLAGGLPLALPSVGASHPGFSADIETVDASPDTGRQSAVVALPDGTFRVAFVRGDSPPEVVVGAGRWNDWSFEVVDASPGAKQYPSIGRAPDGTLAVAYEAEEDGSLRYAARGPGGWTVETVDVVGPAGLYPSVAFDATSRPHIAYLHAQQAELRYAVRSGPLWTVQVVDATGAAGAFASLALRGAEPRIAYYDLANARLMFAAKSGVAWTRQVVDGAQGSGWYADLMLDASGRATIGYYNWKVQEARLAQEQASGAFTLQTVDTAGDVGRGLRLAVDPAGRTGIAYEDTTTPGLVSMRMAFAEGGAWVAGAVETNAGSFWFHDRSDIVSDEQGVYHLFYRRESDQVLRHAVVFLLEPDFTWSPNPAVRLAGTRFTDTSWSRVGTIVAWGWTFPTGPVETMEDPVHVFPDRGVFPVTLRVTTDRGYSASVTKLVPVGNAPPVAIIDGPSKLTATFPGTWDGSRSYDPDGTIVRHDWTFTDGHTAQGASVTHVLPPGVHVVRLEVTDNDGATDAATLVVQVTREFLFVVEMTKPAYWLLEPQDGRVRATTLQGTPIVGLPARVNVTFEFKPDTELLPNPPAPHRVRWEFELVTDEGGIARFQVPLEFTGRAVEDGPEIFSVPGRIFLLGDNGLYEVTARSLSPVLPAKATTSYAVNLLPPGFALPVG